jgi:hypothetical protein
MERQEILLRPAPDAAAEDQISRECRNRWLRDAAFAGHSHQRVCKTAQNLPVRRVIMPAVTRIT